jgi:tetratricopeptide (TPR) repeat protein
MKTRLTYCLALYLLFAAVPVLRADLSSVPECRRALLLAELKEQSPSDAIAACEQAVEKNHKDPWAYRFRAVAYLRAGNLDKADEDIKNALEWLNARTRFGPTAETIHGFRNWAGSMYDYFAWDHASKGEWQKANADWSRALEVDADTSARSLYRGIARARSENCAGALGDFDRFISSHADASTEEARNEILYTLSRQGECYRKIGQIDQARAVARRMIETDARLAAKYGGDSSLDLFDPEVPVKHMQDAATAARAAESSGNLLEAFRQWEEVRRWPEVTGVTPLFARLYPQSSLQLTEESRGALIRLYPKLSAQPALPEGARRFAVRAEREAGLAAPSGQQTTEVSTAEVDTDRYVRAISLYKEALSVAPWWPPGYFNRGMLEARLNHFSAAASDMKVYLALAPDASNARQAQDSVYEWEGRVTRPESLFDPKSLIGTWSGPLSGPLSYYTYRGRIAPDPSGTVQLMILEQDMGKKRVAVGQAYQLEFEGRKFKTRYYDDPGEIVGGEISQSANSMELELTVFACHGFIPVRCANETQRATWNRDGYSTESDVGHVERLRKKGGKL